MTEHRVKYIESIPVEEKYIRLELARQRRIIRVEKEWLAYEPLECMIDVHKTTIAKAKAVIKALKKQLSVPVLSGFVCSACDMELETYEKYCPACGQLLRCGTLYKR